VEAELESHKEQLASSTEELERLKAQSDAGSQFLGTLQAAADGTLQAAQAAADGTFQAAQAATDIPVPWTPPQAAAPVPPAPPTTWATHTKYVMRLQLLSAKGVGDLADCYVSFEVGGHTANSSTAFSAGSADGMILCWNDHEFFTMDVKDAKHDVITVTVWEHNDLIVDRAVAKGYVDVEHLSESRPVVDHRLVLERVEDGSGAPALASPLLDWGATNNATQETVSIQLSMQLLDREKAEMKVTHLITAYEQYNPFTGWSASNLPYDCPAFTSSSDIFDDDEHAKSGASFGNVEPKLDDDWSLGPWQEIQSWQYGATYTAPKWYPTETPLLLFRRRILKRVSTHLDFHD
jgi:hypothetical protein